MAPRQQTEWLASTIPPRSPAKAPLENDLIRCIEHTVKRITHHDIKAFYAKCADVDTLGITSKVDHDAQKIV